MANSKKRFSNRVVVDSEPTWDSKKEIKRIDLINAFNWYNLNKDEKDAAKYLNCSPSIAKNYKSLAWAKRMQDRGCVLLENEASSYSSTNQKFEFEVKSSKEQAIKTAEKTNAPSIQDRIKAKTEEIIGEMEGLIDEYGIRGNVSDMNAYKWMVENEIKSVHANRIVEYFKERSKEVVEAASGKDKELAEGYSIYSKSRLMNLLQCFVHIVRDAEKLAANTKVARKPRKKKPVSFEKRVSKIKYLIKDDKLKLQSIDPVKILGATQLWVYNVKTRKLGVYNSTDASGLDVKGTTILNYSKDSSIMKNLRKPEKVLPIVTDGGKIALRRVLDDVNSKPIKLNGRISKDIILLRVI